MLNTKTRAAILSIAEFLLLCFILCAIPVFAHASEGQESNAALNENAVQASVGEDAAVEQGIAAGPAEGVRNGAPAVDSSDPADQTDTAAKGETGDSATDANQASDADAAQSDADRLENTDAAQSGAQANEQNAQEGELSEGEVSAAQSADTVVMYRLYNPFTGEHFYTSNANERSRCIAAGWYYEGAGWVAPSESSVPVYRLYNRFAGDHHYTTNSAERDYLVSIGWTDEGIGWYSDENNSFAVFREYNPNADTGTHNFTTSMTENDELVEAGWKHEGIAWFAVGKGEDVPVRSLSYIYLDAGHGLGSRTPGAVDSGAVGSGYRECDLTSQLVDRIAYYATEYYNLNVYNNSWTGVYYASRQADAIDRGCTSFLSIHFNATNGTATGSESFSRETNANGRSAEFQDIMHRHLIDALGLPDRGEKTDDFAVLSGIPSTLLEICFIDNASDMATYMGKIEVVARNIAWGLWEAVNNCF